MSKKTNTRVVRCPVCGRLIKTRAIRGFRCCGCEWEIEQNLIQNPKVRQNQISEPTIEPRIEQRPTITEIGQETKLNNFDREEWEDYLPYHQSNKDYGEGFLGDGKVKITFDETTETICIEIKKKQEDGDGGLK